MLNQALILTLVKKLTIKILNLKLVNKLKKYQNIITFLEKAMFQIGLRKFLRLKKLKTLFCGHFFFNNWYQLHARLMSHYKAWSYKKKKHKKIKTYTKSA